jgi:16S rRNA G966 N2-methylase RsmD
VSHGFAEKKYNLVFIDPPYAATQEVETNSDLAGLLDVLGGHVTDNGMVIVRTQRDVFLLEEYGQFRIAERRQWGTMAVTILGKPSPSR